MSVVVGRAWPAPSGSRYGWRSGPAAAGHGWWAGRGVAGQGTPASGQRRPRLRGAVEARPGVGGAPAARWAATPGLPGGPDGGDWAARARRASRSGAEA